MTASEEDDLFLEIGRRLRDRDSMSEAVDGRVMAAVRALPRHRRRGLWSRLTRPRTVVVTPGVWGLAAAAGLLLAAVLGAVSSRVAPAPPEMPARALEGRPVQFLLVAHGANKVSVAGDFNGWNTAHAEFQAEHRGGGVWTVSALVPAGHHRYSFVVDDSVWVADPNAPRLPGDAFGTETSAIVVAGGGN